MSVATYWPLALLAETDLPSARLAPAAVATWDVNGIASAATSPATARTAVRTMVFLCLVGGFPRALRARCLDGIGFLVSCGLAPCRIRALQEFCKIGN